MELRDRIIEATIHHLREHGTLPASVFRFCRDLEIDERAFFGQFPSFNAVESAFWGGTVDRVVQAVTSSETWSGFTARQRLLTFLFAYLEESLQHRSLLLNRVAPLRLLDQPLHLRGMTERYKIFARTILDHGISTGEIADRGHVGRLYPDALAVHLRSVLAFTLKDDSPRFERTDAYVEKTVNFAFDVVRTQAFDTAFDLLRFLAPRPTPAG